MASRHRHILLLAFGLAGPALGLAMPAAAQAPAVAPPASGQAHDEAVCAAQADKNAFTGAHRETYLRECVAGEKLDRPKTDPAKP